jgi:hypothetical protein
MQDEMEKTKKKKHKTRIKSLLLSQGKKVTCILNHRNFISVVINQEKVKRFDSQKAVDCGLSPIADFATSLQSFSTPTTALEGIWKVANPTYPHAFILILYIHIVKNI